MFSSKIPAVNKKNKQVNPEIDRYKPVSHKKHPLNIVSF